MNEMSKIHDEKIILSHSFLWHIFCCELLWIKASKSCENGLRNTYMHADVLALLTDQTWLRHSDDACIKTSAISYIELM